MNAREQLNAVADWLGWQNESLSFGLRSSMDALRLYDYAQAHPDTLAEMADEWTSRQRIAALGYDPLDEREAAEGREVNETGATSAAKAMKAARRLLDSVAFVAKEGDTRPVIKALDAVIGGGAQ
ncbi:hypothetical protein [Paracidovorax wautersii]|uniref:Uncharacterized protein n=1 Tax=Paracidovorax wautersii TaxID=1177982 RepID=A0A1I2HXK6_9BURK|nr:hypothetical protein [Paracidovorax wautersii]SFF34258.1 hypothetical protein SAMN04489711_1424 [Paracidovorax wautersii]